MNAMKKKLSKVGGFTLVEMLIVVAIIAILIAISIPLVRNALEKSRHAVDEANLRDAISLGNIEYLTNSETYARKTTTTYGHYNVDPSTHQGTLTMEPGHSLDYTKGLGEAAKCLGSTCPLKGASGVNNTDYYEGKIVVEIDPDGTVRASFNK